MVEADFFIKIESSSLHYLTVGSGLIRQQIATSLPKRSTFDQDNLAICLLILTNQNNGLVFEVMSKDSMDRHVSLRNQQIRFCETILNCSSLLVIASKAGW
jgi:hypothetical protein